MQSNKVEVKLFAYLRDGRGKRLYMEPSTVREIVETLAIAEEDAYIILINGRDGALSDRLAGGDVLSIFPQVGGG